MAELNGKYVNEENHQKVKGTVLKFGTWFIVFGAIALAIGIGLFITGVVLIFKHATSHEIGFPGAAVACLFPGVILFGVGAALLSVGIRAKLIGHAREIAAYGATTVLPVAGEAINYAADEIAPALGKGLSNLGKGLGDAAGSIAGGIAGGIRNGKKDIVCPVCGEKNLNIAKFCENCGADLSKKETKTTENENSIAFCPNCGDPTAPGQKFCEKCGQKIEQ